MNRLLLIFTVGVLFTGQVLAREVNTEEVAKTMHSMTVLDEVEAGTGSLSWKVTLTDPSKLLSASWVLPAGITNTTTISHIESRNVHSTTTVITTNNFFDPAIVETNYFPGSETQTLITNVLYSGTTTGESIILDAGVNGDLPEYYRILGADTLLFEFSYTNTAVPIKWSMQK